MGQTTEQLKNVDMQTATIAKNGTKDLVRYGMQLAMLNRLLSQNLMTEKEYQKVNGQLKYDYGIVAGL